MRRVADSKMKKSDQETQGISAGILAAGLGLVEEVPFVREMMETTKIWNPKERGAFLGELGRSLAVPQAIQWMATSSDKDVTGNATQRKPATAWQHVELGIPGLRKRVPVKPHAPQPSNPLAESP